MILWDWSEPAVLLCAHVVDTCTLDFYLRLFKWRYQKGSVKGGRSSQSLWGPVGTSQSPAGREAAPVSFCHMSFSLGELAGASSIILVASLCSAASWCRRRAPHTLETASWPPHVWWPKTSQTQMSLCGRMRMDFRRTQRENARSTAGPFARCSRFSHLWWNSLEGSFI